VGRVRLGAELGKAVDGGQDLRRHALTPF
jgi:hypothetical protein